MLAYLYECYGDNSSNHREFNILEDLYYDVENHVWVKVLDDGTALIGLDDVSQYLARRLIFIKHKPPRTRVAKGDLLLCWNPLSG